MLDEAMVAVTAGEVSPIATGIDLLRGDRYAATGVFDLRRAQRMDRWPSADWCDGPARPRARTGGSASSTASQMMQLHGAWSDALAEIEQRPRAPHRAACIRRSGLALYEQGELHRLRGDDRAAEQAYRRASESGHAARARSGLAAVGGRGAGRAGGGGDRSGRSPNRTSPPAAGAAARRSAPRSNLPREMSLPPGRRPTSLPT